MVLALLLILFLVLVSLPLALVLWACLLLAACSEVLPPPVTARE